MFRVAAHTDKGPRKKSNQDSCCALVAQTPVGDMALLVVCDGVGGLASGELASSSMVKWFTTWFEVRLPQLIESHGRDIQALLDSTQTDWEEGAFKMNDALRSYGHEHEVQLGTTCTALLLVNGFDLIVHVGDTRVYRFAAGRMDILTTDQTWVAQEVARGNIPVEKARNHPKRNVILQSVGTQSELQPVFVRGGYDEGDTFLVCCDGFRNELFDDELIESFAYLQEASEGEIHQVIAQLIELVLSRGERDNVTAVVASVQEGDDYGVTEGDVDFPTTRFNDPEDPKVMILPQIDDSGDLRAGE